MARTKASSQREAEEQHRRKLNVLRSPGWHAYDERPLSFIDAFGGTLHDIACLDDSKALNDSLELITNAYGRHQSAVQFEIQDIDKIPVSDNPIADWLEIHAGELARHCGKYVAIHPKKGIVASDAELSDVYRRVQELQLETEVVIDSIPEFGHR